MVAAKPDGLHLIPGPHRVGGERAPSCYPLDLHSEMTDRHPHTCRKEMLLMQDASSGEDGVCVYTVCMCM